MATNLTTKTPVVDKPFVEPVIVDAALAEIIPVNNLATLPAVYRRVYVWELPIRVFHWVNALAIVVLAATGYLIGNPQAIFSANEAYQQYWFGWVRFAHFAAGYVFFLNLLFRIYWGFVANRYARWSSYVPRNKAQFKNLWETITTEVAPIHVHGKVSIGHNFLASFSYLCLFLIILLQSATGFALYADMSSFFLPHLFAWVTPLFGGDAWVRQWHHILMWAFIVFTMIHVYLVVYFDVFEGRGTTSSIIDGWKFEKDEDLRD